MNTEVTLNVKEQKRLKVLNPLESGQITAKIGAGLLGLSVRQVRRLRARYRLQGAAALAHGNRGRPSPCRIPEDLQRRVLELVRRHYPDYNDCHLTEVLNEHHGLPLSRSTVRRIRHAAGLRGPRKRRAPRHRSRRDRHPQRGMLLQIDGSHHDWLEGRGPQLVLIAAIGDATSEVPFALFREHEDAAGYFRLLREIAQRQGLPLALYADPRLQSPQKPSLEQRLAEERARSQFGRLVDELGIQLIQAYSPQARGRIERLFGTLQDRLVKELRRARATTREQADRLLVDFLPSFNARFAMQPPQPELAYRSWPPELDPNTVFCFNHPRTVANDNTIAFDGHRFQIPADRYRGNYARCQVEVRQHLDGRLSIGYQDRQLVCFDPTENGPPQVGRFTPLKSPPRREPEPKPNNGRPKPPKSRSTQPWKPPPDHPWQRPWKSAAEAHENQR